MTEPGEFRPIRPLIPLGLLAAVVVAILSFWNWMGAPIGPHTVLGSVSDKPSCVSYAPFRGVESPVTPGIDIPASRIDEDLQHLAGFTRCVRTYQIDQGAQHVPALAGKYGIKVRQGFWIGRNASDNEKQIAAAIALATRYPDSIESIAVGNEVLLRADQGAEALVAMIKRVKAAVPMRVTYADVWESWLRYPELADAVDFITIHVLPYWEDVPVAAEQAAVHVDEKRRLVAARFPGKEIVIGEVGWPSQGRMRSVAEASPANQARVIRDVMALAKREGFGVNVIEAFDQPWKRGWEGTVGGHWGLFDAQTREPKFAWDGAVSNYPQWRRQAAGGVAMALVIFAVAFATRDKRLALKTSFGRWVGVAIIAAVAGMTIGLALERIPVESFNAGTWVLSLAMAVLALASPLCATAAIMRNSTIPTFAELLGGTPPRPRGVFETTCGIVLLLLTLLATDVALGLVFDPRYRDFPAVGMTCAVVPFAVLAWQSRTSESTGIAETIFAAMLVLAAGYLALNESLANWQALWLSLGLFGLGVTLGRGRIRMGFAALNPS
ncbi:MAG: beta-(1-6) glucans synthase, partial [Xanthobacteraceae bacterium]|nr:beta-(1-6) glucans synthase [Xanthobacteraceae bacterium]